MYISLDRDRRIFIIDLDHAARHCGLLGDRTRIRLLALLEREELTVAELAAITRLAQPRVSTHLARLKDAALVIDRRDGVSVYYRFAVAGGDGTLGRLWETLRGHLDDALLSGDMQRLPEILEARRHGQNWPDSVAGDMERHYSPGRSWEATTRALVRLLTPGRVLDIASGDGVMAELLADQSTHFTCLDMSAKVIHAARARLVERGNVSFHQADMHALPFPDRAFDTVLLLHALTYSTRPEQAIAEAARVLAPGGHLVGATLRKHKHGKEVASYGHVNQGFGEKALAAWCRNAGLDIRHCAVTSVERRPPHYQIITFLGKKS